MAVNKHFKLYSSSIIMTNCESEAGITSLTFQIFFQQAL